MNDIELIYEKVKGSHNLRLANTAALNEGFVWNVPVIYGESQQGRFWLYADEDVPNPHGIGFVFSVEYSEYEEQTEEGLERVAKCHTHWHLQTIEQAVEDVSKFMAGKRIFKK
ncbi:MAG: hypothetical protein IJY39_02195 [Clostridia bacterium]|nr:hypothetical protein [Clostridia bacterium]